MALDGTLGGGGGWFNSRGDIDSAPGIEHAFFTASRIANGFKDQQGKWRIQINRVGEVRFN